MTFVDGRITGIAEAFGFPVCDPNRLSEFLDFDFEVVRNKAATHFESMRRFVDSLSSLKAVHENRTNAEARQ